MSGICAHRSMLRARNIWLLWPWRSQAINWPTQSTTRLSLDSPLDGFARYMLRRLRRIHALECSSYLLGRALLFKRGKRDPPDNASRAKLDAAAARAAEGVARRLSRHRCAASGASASHQFATDG